MVYHNLLETNLLKLFETAENSEWFSIVSDISFEVTSVVKKKENNSGTYFLFFISFHHPQLFYCPVLRPLFWGLCLLVTHSDAMTSKAKSKSNLADKTETIWTQMSSLNVLL